MHQDGLTGVEVDQRNLYLAAIARVDGARTVDDRKSHPRSQSRARVNQADHPVRDGDRDTRSHQGSLPEVQLDVFCAVTIIPRIAVMSAAGQREFGVETISSETGRHGATDYP